MDTTTVASVSVCEVTLNPEELRLIAAYRAADDRGRAETMDYAEHEAAHYPRRAKPALRLVGGAI